MKNKICFLGAGSTVFAKNLLGDCMCCDSMKDYEFSLFDIDLERANITKNILEEVKEKLNVNAEIKVYEDRVEAIEGSRFIISAIQVGGYEPSTVVDFAIPRKYGIEQTIADTTGIAGLMRAFRTIKALEPICAEIEEHAPNALMLNYSNPMPLVTNYMQLNTNVNVVGLCHSVQGCVKDLLLNLGLEDELDYKELAPSYAGINHMNYLVSLRDKNFNDIYPIIMERIEEVLANKENYYAEGSFKGTNSPDFTRYEMAKRFGCYITESSEHAAEYYPFFIKPNHKEIIEEYQIPIDEYISRCKAYLTEIDRLRDMTDYSEFEHTRTTEYASYIFDAILTNVPFVFHGNMTNKGSFKNLNDNVNVEVKCVADINGITQTIQGEIPTAQLGLISPHINLYAMAIEAYKTKSLDKLYQCAYLDQRLSATLTLDEMKNLIDDFVDAHGDYLPTFY